MNSEENQNQQDTLSMQFIEKIHDKMTADLAINPSDILHTAITLPNKIAYWNRYLHKTKIRRLKCKQEFERQQLYLSKYYNGDLPPDEYLKNPRDHYIANKKITKVMLESYIINDPSMKDLQERYDLYEILIGILEFHLKAISQNHYTLGKIMDFIKFQAGH